MNAQLILNRHPRVMQTIYWKAVDEQRNIYDVATGYGYTRTQVRAFLDDFNTNNVDVPRPRGWHDFSNTPAPASPSSELIGPSAQDPNTPSLIDLRLADLERRVAELEKR